MKNLIFSTIALLVFGLNSYSQDKYENHPNSSELSISYDESLKLSCTKINVGINILIAWVSADVYIGCGFPITVQYPTGCMPISQKLCNVIEQYNNKTVDYTLNLKDFFPDVDYSKVTELEITKSDEWIDDNGQTLTIKLGKYKVDSQGNFILEIIKK